MPIRPTYAICPGDLIEVDVLGEHPEIGSTPNRWMAHEIPHLATGASSGAEQATVVGGEHGLSPAAHAELGVDRSDVGLDSVHRYCEVRGDLAQREQ